MIRAVLSSARWIMDRLRLAAQFLNAVTGSTRVARTAGTTQAMIATAASKATAIAADGSQAVTSNSNP